MMIDWSVDWNDKLANWLKDDWQCDLRDWLIDKMIDKLVNLLDDDWLCVIVVSL